MVCLSAFNTRRATMARELRMRIAFSLAWRSTMKRFFTLAAMVALSTAIQAAPPGPAKTLEQATEVLTDLEKIPLKGIPPKLMDDAKAVAIIPNVVKAGFII